MKVLVPHKILKSLQHENLRIAGTHEVGGVLLGYRRGEDIEIVNATFPSNGDKSSRNKFERLSRHHQLVAMKFWKASQKKIDWVGEWHTHPEKTPTPSTIDIKSWRQLVSRHGSPMSFIILGYDGVWIGNVCDSTSKPERLALLEKSKKYALFG